MKDAVDPPVSHLRRRREGRGDFCGVVGIIGVDGGAACGSAAGFHPAAQPVEGVQCPGDFFSADPAQMGGGSGGQRVADCMGAGDPEGNRA